MPKYFFRSKRTHSDVVVGSTLILAQTRAATGRQQEEETRRRHAYILQGKVTLGGTAVRHLEKAGPREGEAAEFSQRKTEVPWWCDYSQDFLVNVWDRDSCPNQEKVCVPTV